MPILDKARKLKLASNLANLIFAENLLSFIAQNVSSVKLRAENTAKNSFTKILIGD